MTTYHELPPDNRILEIDRDRMEMRFLPAGSRLPEGVEPVIERNAFPLHVGFLLYARGSRTSPETKTELLRRHQEVLARSRLPLTRPQYS